MKKPKRIKTGVNIAHLNLEMYKNESSYKNDITY